MVLALLQHSPPGVTPLFAEAGVEVAALQDEIRARMEPGEAAVTPTELPYTSSAKKLLEKTMSAARRRGIAGGGQGRRKASIGPIDLLAGLLDMDGIPVADLLREVGLTLDSGGLPAVSSEAGRARIQVTIDDASDRSIYEQIVVQIQERIAVGDVKPGERLPTVRRLADRLDIAPGTVARAYSELERLGLVVTGGARGTRVAQRHRSTVPDGERSETLVGLLRPVAVAAFHLGATAEEMRRALDEAMVDIFDGNGQASA
jgi:GntR family transcriptional regulator